MKRFLANLGFWMVVFVLLLIGTAMFLAALDIDIDTRQDKELTLFCAGVAAIVVAEYGFSERN